MEWLIITYSLPAGPNSSPRVTLWRRLRRLGAVSVTGGAYLLPLRDECREAFQWLAQEIRQAGGEALILHVRQVEGLSDAEVIALFRAARRKEYAELDTQLTALEQRIAGDQARRSSTLDAIERLRHRLGEALRVDYFDTPEGGHLTARLAQLAAALAPPPVAVPHASIVAYQGRRWVTRPRPHVDRLACAWLIRRFIDPAAVIDYTDTPAVDAVSFDIEDGTFTHTASLCTFETMLRAFELNDLSLQAVAEMVHAIDLRDSQYAHPEIAGLDRVLDGWLLLDATDAERETWGIALFDGLYRGVQRTRAQHSTAEAAIASVKGDDDAVGDA
jgi:hypothetical protein